MYVNLSLRRERIFVHSKPVALKARSASTDVAIMLVASIVDTCKQAANNDLFFNGLLHLKPPERAFGFNKLFCCLTAHQHYLGY